MMMIESLTGREFLKDHDITNLKPQNLTAPTISVDVPSTSVTPLSTRSGIAPPPLATSSTSSDGVLRVLKSMFTWCRDTCQHQDILLSNQRRQNEKMGIDEFEELPIHVPPLDEDPFASLLATDITSMEAAPDADEASDSEYEIEE
jgi:hypothetical protein